MLLRALLLSSVTLSMACAACTVETLVPGSAEPGKTARAEDPASPAAGSASAQPTGSPSGTADGGHDGAAPQGGASAEIDLRVSGDCAPVFQDLVVATNTTAFDSLAIANASAPANGSFQIALSSPRGKVALSTSERTSGRDVINVMAGGVVFTNLCNVSAGGCTYEPESKTWRNDPVAGTVDVTDYDPRSGRLDVKLDNVVLQSTQGKGLCKLHGTVRTRRLGR